MGSKTQIQPQLGDNSRHIPTSLITIPGKSLHALAMEFELRLRRAGTSLSDDTELANITYNDKYVVVYDFSEIGA